MDRLYSTKETGQALGGLRASAVLELIHAGKLQARPLVVRGRNKRPRKYVTASEIERFIRELPTSQQAKAAGGGEAGKPKRQRALTGVRAELEKGHKYY